VWDTLFYLPRESDGGASYMGKFYLKKIKNKKNWRREKVTKIRGETKNKNKNKIKRGKRGEKEDFIFSRCKGGINRKIVVIPFIEVCRWHLRSLWKVP